MDKGKIKKGKKEKNEKLGLTVLTSICLALILTGIMWGTISITENDEAADDGTIHPYTFVLYGETGEEGKYTGVLASQEDWLSLRYKTKEGQPINLEDLSQKEIVYIYIPREIIHYTETVQYLAISLEYEGEIEKQERESWWERAIYRIDKDKVTVSFPYLLHQNTLREWLIDEVKKIPYSFTANTDKIVFDIGRYITQSGRSNTGYITREFTLHETNRTTSVFPATDPYGRNVTRKMFLDEDPVSTLSFSTFLTSPANGYPGDLKNNDIRIRIGWNTGKGIIWNDLFFNKKLHNVLLPAIEPYGSQKIHIRIDIRESETNDFYKDMEYRIPLKAYGEGNTDREKGILDIIIRT